MVWGVGEVGYYVRGSDDCVESMRRKVERSGDDLSWMNYIAGPRHCHIDIRRSIGTIPCCGSMHSASSEGQEKGESNTASAAGEGGISL